MGQFSQEKRKRAHFSTDFPQNNTNWSRMTALETPLQNSWGSNLHKKINQFWFVNTADTTGHVLCKITDKHDSRCLECREEKYQKKSFESWCKQRSRNHKILEQLLLTMAQEGKKRSQSCWVFLDYESVHESLKQIRVFWQLSYSTAHNQSRFWFESSVIAMVTPKIPKYIFQTIK